MNSDIFMQVFLDTLSGQRLHTMAQGLNSLLLPYPVGLFIDRVGPLVANDAYAPREVWERFRRDRYHSPYVIWGREVNLLELGLCKQILAASSRTGSDKETIDGLRLFLDRTLQAVDESGLGSQELWTYRIHRGEPMAERYGTSSDIQLWNQTDLAVKFALHRLLSKKTEKSSLFPLHTEEL
jgi:hypothetical protein